MITTEQKMWLYTRGGRNESDVFEDENGKYVLMSAGTKGEFNRIYLPAKYEFQIHVVHGRKYFNKFLTE